MTIERIHVNRPRFEDGRSCSQIGQISKMS